MSWSLSVRYFSIQAVVPALTVVTLDQLPGLWMSTVVPFWSFFFISQILHCLWPDASPAFFFLFLLFSFLSLLPSLVTFSGVPVFSFLYLPVSSAFSQPFLQFAVCIAHWLAHGHFDGNHGLYAWLVELIFSISYLMYYPVVWCGWRERHSGGGGWH